GQDDVRRERGQFRRVLANALGIARSPPGVDAHVTADGPARLLQPLRERCDAALSFRIVRGERHEHSDAPHLLALLRPRRQRPRRRAAEQRDELAALHHSITLSARASSVAGTSMPSARAVTRLITKSNLVGCSTGRSAGSAPRRILST